MDGGGSLLLPRYTNWFSCVSFRWWLDVERVVFHIGLAKQLEDRSITAVRPVGIGVITAEMLGVGELPTLGDKKVNLRVSPIGADVEGGFGIDFNHGVGFLSLFVVLVVRVFDPLDVDA